MSMNYSQQFSGGTIVGEGAVFPKFRIHESPTAALPRDHLKIRSGNNDQFCGDLSRGLQRRCHGM